MLYYHIFVIMSTDFKIFKKTFLKTIDIRNISVIIIIVRDIVQISNFNLANLAAKQICLKLLI